MYENIISYDHIWNNSIRVQHPEVLDILLIDQSTSTPNNIKNIIWANDHYIEYDCNLFAPTAEIKRDLITGTMSDIVIPRSLKTDHLKKKRTREKAEVFTPTWIVKRQNDEIDKDFHNDDLVTYVQRIWLEVTCGEGPYMATRYDMETGVIIPINKRVGFLDRKLSRINQEIFDQQTWQQLTETAYKSTYGFEWNGDSLLLARENLLYTYHDYYLTKWGSEPSVKSLKNIAEIISHNIFQMDGLKYITPLQGKHIKIMNWDTNKMIYFENVLSHNNCGGNGGTMKFNVVVGNPPYQMSDQGKRDNGTVNASASPLYHYFFDLAKDISESKISLIIPARWLTGAGKGLGEFKKKMLEDTHIKSLTLFKNATKVFPSANIKGGVLYLTYDKNYDGKANITVIDTDESVTTFSNYLNTDNLGVFIPYKELLNIYRKITSRVDLTANNMQQIISSRKPFGLTTDFFKDPRKYNLPPISTVKQSDDDLEIIGLERLKRVSRYVPKDYPIPSGKDLINGWKVLTPYAYGTGKFGEVSPSLILANPNQIATETFLVIGPFTTEFEARSMIKYFKTKFFRALIGILKTTQHSTTTYRLIPKQDFSSQNQAIDWTKTIPEIDQQLFKKYDLTDQEINFIQTKVEATID